MSLVTRCPQCRTLFRVTPAQLQAATGQVRCGRCTNVFDGYAALTPEAAKAAPNAHDIPEQVSSTPAAKPEVAAAPAEAPRRVSATARYAVSIVLLIALLTIQAAYAFRAEFAARSLALRSAMESVCEFAGCAVALPQRPESLRIEADA